MAARTSAAIRRLRRGSTAGDATKKSRAACIDNAAVPAGVASSESVMGWSFLGDK